MRRTWRLLYSLLFLRLRSISCNFFGNRMPHPCSIFEGMNFVPLLRIGLFRIFPSNFPHKRSYGNDSLIPKDKKGLLHKSNLTHAAAPFAMLFIARNQSRPNLSFRMTSCEPPSTMLVADTSVIFALSRSSPKVSAPQLHIVERILLSEMRRLSRRGPA